MIWSTLAASKRNSDSLQNSTKFTLQKPDPYHIILDLIQNVALKKYMKRSQTEVLQFHWFLGTVLVGPADHFSQCELYPSTWVLTLWTRILSVNSPGTEGQHTNGANSQDATKKTGASCSGWTPFRLTIEGVLQLLWAHQLWLQVVQHLEKRAESYTFQAMPLSAATWQGCGQANTSLAARSPAWTAPFRKPHHTVALSVPAKWILRAK